jgi:hypothetical protein
MYLKAMGGWTWFASSIAVFVLAQLAEVGEY